MMGRRGRTGGIVMLAIAALTVSVASTAARSPTPAEQVALVKAATMYIDRAENHCCVHGLRATAVTSRTRVSTAKPGWAIVYVHIKDSLGKQVQGALVVLEQIHIAWRVKREGNVFLGCGIPEVVRNDLNLSVPPNGCR